jgi:hypothetical protein
VHLTRRESLNPLNSLSNNSLFKPTSLLPSLQTHLLSFSTLNPPWPSTSTEPTWPLRHRSTTAQQRTTPVVTKAPRPTIQTCLISEAHTPATMIRMDNLKTERSIDGSAVPAKEITAATSTQVARTVRTIGGTRAAMCTCTSASKCR